MPSDSTQNVIAEFRANEGRLGGELAGTSILLIHHLGVRTLAERVTPVAYHLLPDGRLVIAASNGGSPIHPAWYYNVKARPTIKVELGTETFTALAQEVTGAEHATLWPELIAASPALGEFQAKTTRHIPLLTLTRRTACAVPPGPSRGPSEVGHRTLNMTSENCGRPSGLQL